MSITRFCGVLLGKLFRSCKKKKKVIWALRSYIFILTSHYKGEALDKARGTLSNCMGRIPLLPWPLYSSDAIRAKKPERSNYDTPLKELIFLSVLTRFYEFFLRGAGRAQVAEGSPVTRIMIVLLYLR